MFKCIHADRILPGKMAETLEAMRAEPPDEYPRALESIGIRSLTAFVSTEVETDGDGLLVFVFEADDPSAVEQYFKLDVVQPIIEQFDGVLVAKHTHDGVARNVPVAEVPVG